jgi:hypothetical protein
VIAGFLFTLNERRDLLPESVADKGRPASDPGKDIRAGDG